MLKFIRKYQLLILVVGGTLLMIVFLLQPILTRLAPSPLRAKVATLDDGTTFTRGDIQRARAALTLLGRSNPRALQPRSAGGLGLASDSDQSAALHWLMLADHARRYGLVGEAGDGQTWINEIAEFEALLQLQAEVQQGLHQNQAEQEQRLLELRSQIIDIINRNASIAAGSMNGTMEDVYRILAEARGMYRLIGGLERLPAFSDRGAMAAAERIYDAVAVDAVLIESSVVTSGIEEPDADALQSFFERFRDQRPSESDFGIGYVQPTRIQLGWITLDKGDSMDAIEIDRVELSKMWQQDRETYPGDFAAERFELEQRYREEQATEMMVEADRIIRAQVLTKTKGLTKQDGVLQLPDDWESRYPRLETIAETVSERLNERFGVSLPALEVNMVGDRWLNQNDITTLEGIGSAVYLVGSRQIPVYALPQFFEPDAPTNIGLDVQPLLPIVDHAATDQQDNRYYAMVLDVRRAGPSDSIEDAGRERVVNDYKSLKAFELLSARADELDALVESSNELAPAVDSVMSMDSADSARPGVLRQILVRENSIDPGRVSRFVNPRLNNELFRDAVLRAAEDIDPLISPEELAQNPIAVGVPIPQARALALAKIVAPRPLTLEEYRVRALQALAQLGSEELRDAGYIENNPFSFEALSERYGLEVILEDDDA